MKSRKTLFVGLAVLFCGIGHGAENSTRVRPGLQVLYEFSGGEATRILDSSGVGEALDLEVDAKSLAWGSGMVELRETGSFHSDGPANKLIEAVERTGEFTLEAWLTPADTGLTGPARIITLSRDGSNRNFTLGQDGDRFDVRFRTTGTSSNGLPSVSSPEASVKTELTHVLYARDRSGRTRLYVNGELVKEEVIDGGLDAWDGNYKLGLGNEFSGDRAWRGTFHLVALYNRGLRPHEVRRHFEAGPEAPTDAPLVQQARGDFEENIAPVFAEHCLECHRADRQKGGLDLSTKDAAFAGGDGGAAIAPGNAAESLLWKQIASDEMPYNRDPLDDGTKRAIEAWIDAGAEWTTDSVVAAVEAPSEVATANWLRRLTLDEYIETVRSATGVAIDEEARELLPPDLRADGFSNTAYNLGVDFGHIDAYSKLASIIVGKMDVTAYAKRFSKSQRLIDDDMRGLVSKMGRHLLRGPLESHEVDAFRGITSTVASAGGDFEEAVALVIESMLQSPRFLYRIELQLGDGTPWPVDAYALASRLSYAIVGGPPDDTLMKAAASGELLDRDRAAEEVERLLEDPRALKQSLRFAREWLDLNRLDNLRPNAAHFPGWDPKLAEDMREETLAFFEEVAWKRGEPLEALLNAQVTFATPRLAEHYGLPANGEALAQYDLGEVPERGGILTQASLLTIGGDEASMVTRGLFVLRDLLRDNVGDPPPNLDTTPVPPEPGKSRRGVAEGRVADPTCGGCHVKFEPLAFGLEKFDGLGGFSDVDEHGNELRMDGEVRFPGEKEPVPYDSIAELMDVLAGHPRVHESLTWKVVQFAVGRPLGTADVPMLEEIHANARKDGGSYASLMKAIALSDIMWTTQTEATQ